VAEVYGATEISERHRHRYEVNTKLRKDLAKHGMTVSGWSPDRAAAGDHGDSRTSLVHRGAFPSRTEIRGRWSPHPLFTSFIAAAVQKAGWCSTIVIPGECERSEHEGRGPGVSTHALFRLYASEQTQRHFVRRCDDDLGRRAGEHKAKLFGLTNVTAWTFWFGMKFMAISTMPSPARNRSRAGTVLENPADRRTQFRLE